MLTFLFSTKTCLPAVNPKSADFATFTEARRQVE